MLKPFHPQIRVRLRLFLPLLGLLGLQIAMGCSKPPPPMVAPAKPSIITFQLQVAVLADNQMNVRLRNDGEAGRVMIIVRGNRYKKSTERGESGLEKSLRENFTTKPEPSSKNVVTWQDARDWKEIIQMASGETTDVVIKLPGHSSWDDVSFSVRAVGIF